MCCTYPDSVPLRGLAQWDGSDWAPMGDGFLGNALGQPYHQGMDLELFQDELYLAGWFEQVTSVPNTYKVAKWDGSAFHSVGLDSSQFLLSGTGVLEIAQGELHLLGNCSIVLDGDTATNWAIFDGTTWRAGDASEDFYFATGSIREYQGLLHIGGNFTTAGGLNDLVRKTANGYEELGPGINGDPWVNDLEVYDGLLWVIGEFAASWGNVASGLMAWDGNQWLDPFPDIAFTGMGRDLAIINGDLYFNGPFVVNGLQGTYFIGRYDGEQLCIIGGNQIWVDKLVGSADTLYATTCLYQDCTSSSPMIRYIMKLPMDHPPDTCFTIAQSLAEGPGEPRAAQVFPNPNNGQFTLRLPAGLGPEVQFAAYDAQGRQLPMEVDRNGYVYTCTLPGAVQGVVYLHWSDGKQSGGLPVVVGKP